MHPTKTNILLGAALAASLAVNAVALWPAPKPSPRPAAPAPPANHEHEVRREADPFAKLNACEERLKANQAKDALRSLAAGLRSARAEGRVAGGGDRAREEIVCEIAEREMRDRWREKEKETLANVRKSLRDAAEVDRSAANDARRFAESLGSGDADRERLVERYLPVRRERMAAVAAAVAAEPVDYGAARAAFVGLWQDENRLIGEIYGAAAAEQFAADAEKGRLGVLMIIAAMSGGPMPDAVL